jgi:F-box-like
MQQTAADAAPQQQQEEEDHSVEMGELPDEVLAQIVRSLPWRDRISAAERVSRRWRRVAVDAGWGDFRQLDDSCLRPVGIPAFADYPVHSLIPSHPFRPSPRPSPSEDAPRQRHAPPSSTGPCSCWPAAATPSPSWGSMGWSPRPSSGRWSSSAPGSAISAYGQ